MDQIAPRPYAAGFLDVSVVTENTGPRYTVREERMRSLFACGAAAECLREDLGMQTI